MSCKTGAFEWWAVAEAEALHDSACNLVHLVVDKP